MERLSSLSHLFNSNEPPGASEVILIDYAISLMDRTIANIASQPGTVANLTAQLKNERQQCRAVLSLIRRMPLDVLGEIFGHAVDAARVRSYRCGINQAVVCCLICKTWRDAAYATHRLWTSFEVSFPPHWRHWERVERWMHLSKAVPKHISVYGHLSHPRLVRLLTQGPDIHTLTISCENSLSLQDLCRKVIQSTAPKGASSRPWDRIEVLSILVRSEWSELPSKEYLALVPTATPDDSVEEAHGNGSFLQHLPIAKSFHLNTPFRHFGQSLSIPVPRAFLSHLTTLSLDNNWSGCAVPMVLRLCHRSNLKELILGFKSTPVDYLCGEREEIQWVEEIWGNTKKAFIFPKLRLLRLRRLHPVAFKITRFFNAPSLMELELDVDGVNSQDLPSYDDLGAEISRFIERSACSATLRRLALRGGLRLQMDDLKQWLKKTTLPALSHLTFDGVYLPQELFDRLRLRHVNGSYALPLYHIGTVELLNLPTEVHVPASYLRATI